MSRSPSEPIEGYCFSPWPSQPLEAELKGQLEGPRKTVCSAALACSEGWQYSDDQTQIRLCGNTCETVRNSEGTLDLQFGCSTIVR